MAGSLTKEVINEESLTDKKYVTGLRCVCLFCCCLPFFFVVGHSASISFPFIILYSCILFVLFWNKTYQLLIKIYIY